MFPPWNGTKGKGFYIVSSPSCSLEWSFWNVEAHDIEIDLRIFRVPWLSCLALRNMPSWMIRTEGARITCPKSSPPRYLRQGKPEKSHWVAPWKITILYITPDKTQMFVHMKEKDGDVISKFEVLSKSCRFCSHAFCVDIESITWHKSISKDLCGWSRLSELQEFMGKWPLSCLHSSLPQICCLIRLDSW